MEHNLQYSSEAEFVPIVINEKAIEVVSSVNLPGLNIS